MDEGNKNKIQRFKQDLSLVFDDGLDTKVWNNYVDYAIIATILISTCEILLSTYAPAVVAYGNWLASISIITTILFTVEIIMRIWTCSIVNPAYIGWRGKLTYCISFYGLLDLLAILPFYVSLIFPIHLGVIQILKVLRVFRIMRYGKSFGHLRDAIQSKKSELLVSMQFLTVITAILSIVLFIVENHAQPKVFDSVVTTMLWSFSKYIGDPAGFGGFVPVTLIGQIIASIVGILGIAIFAVPAGLIGSGFLEVMEEEKKKEEIETNIKSIQTGYKNKLCKVTNLYFPPRYQRIETIKAKLDFTDEEVLKTIRNCQNFRSRNLATAETPHRKKEDVLVIEHYPVNTVYGSYEDKGSNITIVNPAGRSEVGISYFTNHLANLGGFNYVSNEFFALNELKEESTYGFYNIQPDLPPCTAYEKYKSDILALSKTQNDWIILILSSDGGIANVPYDADFHFLFGGNKGDESLDCIGSTITDVTRFKEFFLGFSELINSQYGRKATTHKYYTNTNSKNIAVHLQKETDANILTLRVTWDVSCWDERVNGIIILLAEQLKKHIDTSNSKDLNLIDYSKRHF